VLDNIEVKHQVDLKKIPRFNESEGHGPKRAHPVEDYFDDLSMHLIWEIYKRDFQLFRYDFDNPATRCRRARSIWTRFTPSWATEMARRQSADYSPAFESDPAFAGISWKGQRGIPVAGQAEGARCTTGSFCGNGSRLRCAGCM
jgi:hypothetical protein